MNEDDIARLTRGMTLRSEVKTVQCRCSIEGTNGRDRCAVKCESPDQGICNGCLENHFGRSGYEVVEA